MKKPLLTLLLLLILGPVLGLAQRAHVVRSPADSRSRPALTLVTNLDLRLSKFRHDLATARAEAARELAAHLPLVTTNTYAELGLKSVDEAARWRVGEPMVLHLLNFDDLEDVLYGRSDELQSDHRLWFPVEVDGTTRAMLALEKSGRRWEGIIFGMARTAQQLAKARQEAAATHRQPAETFAVVELTPLRFFALAFTVNGRLMLVPTRAVPGTRITAGEARPAAEVLAALHPHWRQWRDESAKAGRPVAR